MLPPVLVGLGLFSTISAWCLIVLERLQPLFFTVAVAALAYQVWLVRKRPPALRTGLVKAILAVSLGLNGLMIAGWLFITFRYR